MIQYVNDDILIAGRKRGAASQRIRARLRSAVERGAELVTSRVSSAIAPEEGPEEQIEVVPPSPGFQVSKEVLIYGGLGLLAFILLSRR